MKEAISHSFRVDTNVLVVSFREPDSEEIQEYDIAPVYLLDEVMREDGERGRSQLIFHLSDKKWVSMTMLYDLAMHINHFRPYNKIDWVTSLLDVELSRIASRLADENCVVAHTDPSDLAEGHLSHSDQLGMTLMHGKYLSQLDANTNTYQQARQKVLDELKKRLVA